MGRCAPAMGLACAAARLRQDARTRLLERFQGENLTDLEVQPTAVTVRQNLSPD